MSSLAVSGSTVYVGGEFSQIGGAARENLAALNPDSGAAKAWNPGADGSVYALAARGKTVYIGGYFSKVGGKPRNDLASVDAQSGAVSR